MKPFTKSALSVAVQASLFSAAVGLSPVLTVIPPFPTSNRGGQDEFTLMESGIPQPAWGHAEADA